MPQRPNILIFMTDQERGDVVAPGHPCQTPNADRLAAQGIRFTQTYTPYAHCCPSRATFMTGLYPSRHGVYNNLLTPTAINLGLNEGVVTFSELMRDDGYKMTLCGKWHVSAEENPSDRGWDEKAVTAVKGTRHSANPIDSGGRGHARRTAVKIGHAAMCSARAGATSSSTRQRRTADPRATRRSTTTR